MSNNPLKNFFRKPALTIRLPSNGNGYREGSIDIPDTREIPVYPMTAIDEVNVRTPDALVNGSAVVNLIKSCVPNIKDPWEVSNVDLDTILIAIKIATTGPKLNVESECGNCEGTNNTQLNLFETLESIQKADYDDPLSVDQLQIKFKPLNYKQVINSNELQMEVQKKISAINDPEVSDDEKAKITNNIVKELNQLSMSLVLDTIEYVRTPDSAVFEREFIKEFLENCDRETFEKIKNKNIDLRTQSEVKPFNVTCVHCSNQYDVDLNINIDSL